MVLGLFFPTECTMEGMKKARGDSLETSLSSFLSPAELLFNRRPSTKLDFLLPSISNRVLKHQEHQKIAYDRNSKLRRFQQQDKIYVHNFSGGDPRTICKCLGSLTFLIDLEDGRTIRHHIDHVRSREATATSTKSDAEWLDFPILGSNQSVCSIVDGEQSYPVYYTSGVVSKPS